MRVRRHRKSCQACLVIAQQGSVSIEELGDGDLDRYLCPEGERIFAEERILAKLNNLESNGCFLNGAALMILVLLWAIFLNVIRSHGP